MIGEIQLRETTLDDYAALSELFTRVYPDEPPMAPETLKWLFERGDPERPNARIVAEAEGRILGSRPIAGALMTEEIVLYAGEIGTQRVRVWLEPATDGGFMLNSHDIGPGLERFFGDTEIETYLTVRAEQLPKVAEVLACAPTLADVMAVLVDRYRGDSAATTHLRAVLDEHGVPYEFSLL